MQARPSVLDDSMVELQQRTRALGSKCVLVVDDEHDPRELVTRVLERAGLKVIGVENVDEAFEVLDCEVVDLVVSDIGMPQIDGIAFVRRMRAVPRWLSIPTIAVSGFAQPEDRQRALEAGFNAHFPKPFDSLTLLKAVIHLAAADRTSPER